MEQMDALTIDMREELKDCRKEAYVCDTCKHFTGALQSFGGRGGCWYLVEAQFDTNSPDWPSVAASCMTCPEDTCDKWTSRK